MDPNQELYHLEHCENLPVTAAEVTTETQAHPDSDDLGIPSFQDIRLLPACAQHKLSSHNS